jgi:hypothetical protein
MIADPKGEALTDYPNGRRVPIHHKTGCVGSTGSP